MELERETAEIYEQRLAAGASEEEARDAALALWRARRPAAGDYETRQAVARIIAAVRLRLRKERQERLERE